MAAKQENQVRLLALSPFTVRIDSDVQLSPFGRVNETTDLDQSHDADSEDSDENLLNSYISASRRISPHARAR